MNSERIIKKFIDKSVKRGSPFLGASELRALLETMATQEIQIFWGSYSAMKAFSETNTRVPDWKTKESEKYFLEKSRSYSFYPTEKDKEGKYIIERENLISHVVGHISNIIEEEIHANVVFKNKPLIERLPAYSLASTLVMIPISLVCLLLSNYTFFRIAFWACGILYLINIAVYIIAKTIVGKRR
jgi:hypothetical protein